MSPGGARAKGANGEKEVLRILEDQLGLKLVRNKQQSARGGRDICEDVDRMQGPIGFSIEVKRCEREELSKWWKQTVDQARAVSRIPVLFFRASRQPWRIAACPSDVNEETWPKPETVWPEIDGARYDPIVMQLGVGLQWMREKL